MRSAETTPEVLHAPESRSAHEPEPPAVEGAKVLVLNHHRDPLRDLITALRQAGFDPTEARSLADSHRLLDGATPDVVILNPLVLKAGGVELGLVETLQRADRPVPVILVVDGLRELDQARRLSVPIRDFLTRPIDVGECVARVEFALQNRESLSRLQAHARELEGQVTVDFKTGLLSDRHFKHVLQVEFKRAQRHRTPLSLLLVDIDDFKSINDSTDYAFGDLVLRHVATGLRDGIRETDFAARFGGDEFVLLLPQTSPAEAVQTAMRIRKKIAQQVVRSRGFERNATLSIGIDTFDGRAEYSALEFRGRANRALHEAKRRGKNQVWLYTDDRAPDKSDASADGNAS